MDNTMPLLLFLNKKGGYFMSLEEPPGTIHASADNKPHISEETAKNLFPFVIVFSVIMFVYVTIKTLFFPHTYTKDEITQHQKNTKTAIIQEHKIQQKVQPFACPFGQDKSMIGLAKC